MARVRLQEGDITQVEVDAIVNAANTDLLLGAGVAGAIRERGGPSIQAECDALGPVELGAAAITTAGDLPTGHVIHAAVLEIGTRVDEPSLRKVVRNCLELARQRQLVSIAFPALGTGFGGFSLQRCAEVMFEEVDAHLERSDSPQDVRFVLFGEPAYRVFEMVQDAQRVRVGLAVLDAAKDTDGA